MKLVNTNHVVLFLASGKSPLYALWTGNQFQKTRYIKGETNKNFLFSFMYFMELGNLSISLLLAVMKRHFIAVTLRPSRSVICISVVFLFADNKRCDLWCFALNFIPKFEVI